MRIGLFTDSYPPHANGVAISVLNLKIALEKLGHKVYVVTVNNDKLTYNYDSKNKIMRLPSVAIGLYDYRISGIYNIKAVKEIKKWNLDIIHTHMEFGIGIFGRIISSKLGIPLIHTYHTLYEDYTHYITKGYFDGTAKKIVKHITMFYCDKTASELIVPSAKTFKLFKEKYSFEKDIHIIPTGLEIEKFYKEAHKEADIKKLKKELGIKETDFVMLCLGRVAKEKKTDKLVEWHKHISKKYPNAKLLLVGPGPEIPELEKKAEKLGIRDKIIFTGKVDYSKVPLYYQVADIFVIASTSETQGVIVIEAAAASLPVVAADDESFKIIVVNELNGLLFKNEKGYINSVSRLIEEPETRKLFAKGARNSSKNHSNNFFGERVSEVYKNAIEKTGGIGKKGFFQKMKNEVKKGFYEE